MLLIIMKKNQKYIFVIGGVMSGVGKGIASSSIGKILQSKGFKINPIKVDPYLNVDAGTMNPTEHGEVFVLGILEVHFLLPVRFMDLFPA